MQIHRSRLWTFGVGMLLILAGLGAAYDVSGLLFHSVAEIFSVTVSGAVFMLAWNSESFVVRSFLPLLGVTYLLTGSLDLVHALAYEGMNVLPSNGGNLATQFWLVARIVESIGLVTSSLMLQHQGSRTVPTILLTGLALFLFLMIVTGRFPTCFVDGVGLTPFKIISEYAVCAVLAGAGWLLWHIRSRLEPEVAWLLIASIAVTIVSELCFTLYTSPFGSFNAAGHVLKVVSFYLVYRAVFEVGLKKPYGLLFRELEQQRLALEAANRELDSYARTVSHDIRSPLSTISNSALIIEKLLEGQPQAESSDRIRSALGAIGRSVRSALQLIDDLLTLARAGQSPVHVEPVDVGEVIDRVRSELDGNLKRSDMRLEGVGYLGSIVASPAHIYQVFSNLVRNSLTHGHRQGGCIRLTYRAGDRPGCHQWRLCDDGPGIPEELLEEIFKPFFRASGAGGSGIGLSIVAKIVSVYQGTIHAMSDGGACFELTMFDANPVKRASA